MNTKICPNNFFCFNKNTFLIFIVFLIVFITYKINLYNNLIKDKDNDLFNKIVENNNLQSKINLNIQQINHLKLSKDISNNQNQNQNPPLREPIHSIPININTRGEVKNFQQIGIIYQEGDDTSKKILPISLSYDHRIIDGAEGARFCVYLGKCLGKDFAFKLAV